MSTETTPGWHVKFLGWRNWRFAAGRLRDMKRRTYARWLRVGPLQFVERL
jgi:hypothetical protein